MTPASPLASATAAAWRQCLGLARTTVPEALADEHATYAASPGGSNIAWLLGHMAIVPGLFLAPHIGLGPQVPEAWGGQFGMGSKASPDMGAYPPYGELRSGLLRALEAAADRAEAMSDEDLARAMPDDFPVRDLAPTMAAFHSFIQLHTNYHLGQVVTLLKAQGLPGGVGR